MLRMTNRDTLSPASPKPFVRYLQGTVLAIMTALAVTSCGEPDDESMTPAERRAELMQTVSLEYTQDTANYEVRRIPVEAGKIVTVQVSSDVDANVAIPEYKLKRSVPAGGETALTFSADDLGVFDVVAKIDGVTNTIAKLDVSEK